MQVKTSPQRVVLRSRIHLPAAEGLPDNAMAHRWETSRPTVRLWRTWFNERAPRVCPRMPRMGQCPPPVAPKSPSQPGGHAAYDAARRDPLAHAQGVSPASVAQI